MVQAGAYFDILDWLDRRETWDPPAFLARLQAAYGTGPITYLDAVTSNGRLRPQRILHSQRRDIQLIARSLQRKPAQEQLLRVFSALEPMQLVSWQNTGNSDQVMLGYPLPSLPGRHNCLLVESSASRQDVSAWCRVHDRDLLSLGAIFNGRMARSKRLAPGGKVRKHPLTRRERETLAWIAAGKSYWETAVILGISERTIRHFMANARQKLDVVNNAQAVAEAVWQDLIPRLAEHQLP
ncbi:helix-turn-helix transcriptional regulator [Rhizobium sp. 'Codium 1']|uniref:helix-turn-helix transcriptional regulator n=1 Tax=Rhizobium sp. 'Codium 1' TaxID=2940484 RepID=UPI001E593A27|nr:helix-turn-helix domain-containing protein [Rhizobium sp. 'Codium 1']MCC8933588.1 helix-turn-helix domain-containing protein [Rhizobium sp. 'Codium 1']